jgi:hypothetical protein
LFTKKQNKLLLTLLFDVDEICPLLDQPYNKHMGLINHIFISSTSQKIVKVVMTKQKSMRLLRTSLILLQRPSQHGAKH